MSRLGSESRRAAIVWVAVVLIAMGMTSPARAAAVTVAPNVETDQVHSSGDAADDGAIWIHPTDPSLSLMIGADKTATGGLSLYDLSGREIRFYQVGRINNVDVRYNFPLGATRVGLVGGTNRGTAHSLDFWSVNPSDRSLTFAGRVPIAPELSTPRGFAMYHSPESGKYYAFVSDSGKTWQYEITGDSGTVTGTLVRKLPTIPNATEGLVADDELARLYIAEEDVGGIWRFGAEPTDATPGVKIAKTTENGGPIKQDVKGLTIYYGTNGTGYVIAASQGGSSYHVFDRRSAAYVGEFKIGSGGAIDGVTGVDGIDVTNFPLGSAFPSGFFVSQDHVNEGGANQNYKLVSWSRVANAFSPVLIVDPGWDPRLVGASLVEPGPDTTILSGPSNPTSDPTATFAFTSSQSGSTFECALDRNAWQSCTSPASYGGLADGGHVFEVRAISPAGQTDATPATRSWTVDSTPPRVTSIQPGNGQSAVAANTNVVITFSESMDATTLSGATLQVIAEGSPEPVPAAITYAAASATATIDPTSTLAADATYAVSVDGGVRDRAGNMMGADVQSTFTTGSSAPPSGIVRASISTVANATATSSVAIPAPAGVAAGDVLVACLATNGGAVSAGGVPAGWSPFASVVSVSNPHVFGFYKVAGVNEPTSYRWTLTASLQNGGGIARYAGVSTATPLDGTAATAAGPNATSASVSGATTATANAMLVGCMAINSSSLGVAIQSPHGMMEAWDVGGKRHELADELVSTPGPVGARAWSLSAARAWAGWLVPLRPRS